ncbi:MAG: MFS transporter [Bdellovibrionaceae bacterium]|nr:MFS transporter [Bdellovibrionales bacterium]MCB9084511.1 MFS transporter [Pseudobdellovibrionaceae bacterium]
MSIRLIFRDKKFTPMFWTQFFGAFNDNVMKNALVLLITFKSVSLMGLETNALVAAAGGIFILPFVLFSTHAGQIADKFEKSQLIRYTKIWELMIMVLAGIGFYLDSYGLLLFLLFLMGTQSTFFGPIKYSILPNLVPPERLTEGNAYIQSGTFVSILLGTIAGGLATGLEDATIVIVTTLIIIALLGLVASWKIPPVPMGQPDLEFAWNPFPTMKSFWAIIREKKAVFNSVLGISWFWFFGAGILTVLPVYCKDYLGVNQNVVTAFLAMFTVGIGIGSLLCSKLSFKRVEIGLVPIGSLGMTIFLIDLFLVVPSWTMDPTYPLGIKEFFGYRESWRLLSDFLLMSIFAGFYILPLNTLIQERSHSESRSRVVAANNILNAFFMVVASVVVMAFYMLHFSHPQVFLVFAILNAFAAVYIYSIVPEFTLRFYSWILCHLMYRLKVTGDENIPKEGPAILTSNHVSFVDWLILSAASPRPVRFIMYYKFFEVPLIRHLMKQARVIPIAGAKEDPEILKRAFEQIAAELKDGEIVCIFPEGKVTHDGKISAFRPGLLKMLESNPVPVIPMSLTGMWGSLFSRKDKSLSKKRPRRFWHQIQVDIAPPMNPQGFRLEELEKKIRLMAGDMAIANGTDSGGSAPSTFPTDSL